ncbi:MAG: flagellar biosynthetic protein FliR [Spirochaetes bacterium]|nr:flagellar biosynthetic protein FliR [Spirochaetota bacterium]
MVRMLALLTVAPMYSTTVIPFQVRAGASFVITALLFPLVADMRLTVPNEFIPYVLTVANEVMIGLLIGFLLSIIFAAFQTAARFFEVQMGFGVTDTLDPLSQISIPIIGQFQNLIATLVFISVKGHHLVILALYESYKKLPVLGNASKTVFTAKSGTVIDVILTFSASMFSIALKLAFPMIATLFLLSLSLGLLAKAAPQMNILMLGFPVQVGLGIITYMVITPMLVGTIATVIQTTFIDITRVLGGLGAVSP